MQDNAPLLQLSDIACARGGRVVLEGVSFSLRPGQGVALRGANGSGKTTLLRTIAGLQPPVSGTITCAEEGLAFASHADGLKGALTVSENLLFWATLHGQDGINAALSAFALSDLQDRRAANLSAGQKRRLGLARLLVTGRRIWILDEPTVSLDYAATQLFAQVVQAHLAKGGVALMATHIDLGFECQDLDLTTFQASRAVASEFDEAFA